MGAKVIFVEEHSRSFINKECYLPHRPNFLSAFLALFEIFLQFKGIFKGVLRINLSGVGHCRYLKIQLDSET